MNDLSIIVFTDGIPGESSLGSTRTLQNIFETLENVYFISTLSRPDGDQTYPLSVQKPAIAKLLSRSSYCNLSLVNTWIDPGILRTISRPCIAIVSASRLEAYVYAVLTTKRHTIPLLPYFMDDLRANDATRWWRNDAFSFFRALLNDSPAWLFNSTQLSERLTAHYGVTPKPQLLLHNPVNTQRFNITVTEHAEKTASTGTVIFYAGSVWQMHRDALELLGNAVQLLADSGLEISLRILCPKDQFPSKFSYYDAVSWQAVVPYTELLPELSKATLLAVCSSFEREMFDLSSGSIQTKITDYMAAGRPLIGIGPAQSASIDFIKKNKAGFVVCENSVDRLAERLKQILGEASNFSRIGENNQEFIETHHSSHQIAIEVREFLSTWAT